MTGITSHLARRAVELAQSNTWPAWAVALVVGTVLVYAMTMLMVQYVYGQVIATLTIVESAHDKMYLSVDAVDFGGESKSGDDDIIIEPEALLIKRPLVTATLRSARRFLVAQGGLRTAFRGLGLYIVYAVTASVIDKLLQITILPRSALTPSVSAIASSVLVCRLMLTWTHVVVSQPSSESWGRRIPAARSAVDIAPATALWAAAQQLNVQIAARLPGALSYGLGLDRAVDVSGDPIAANGRVMAVLFKLLFVGLVCLAAMFAVQIPAHVILTRVQTSMLPDTVDTIVPVDRTFGGKVAEGQRVGLLDAWRSFAWPSWFRLLKLYVKVAFIHIFLTILFLFVLIAEIQVITGRTLWGGVDDVKVALARGQSN